MYKKSDDFPLDFGQFMAIENLKNNFFYHFSFPFLAIYRPPAKKRGLAVNYLGLLIFIHLNLWVTFSSAIDF
jgi:hypothetical protein